MSDYPMLISNKLHSFRNFVSQNYQIIKDTLPYLYHISVELIQLSLIWIKLLIITKLL